MAKIINKGRKVIRNAHLIGSGTPFKAVRNANKSINWGASIAQQSGKGPKRPITKAQTPAKTTPKVKVAGSQNKVAKTQTWKKAPTSQSRFKTQAAKMMKQKPQAKTTQIKITPPKPPRKGR